jgi:signal transduction histidine kinase
MTVSYVVATVGIVVFIEALAGAFVLPHLTSGQDVTVRALDTAGLLAKRLGGTVTASGSLQSLGAAGLPTATKNEPLQLVLDTSGRIVGTNSPSAYPDGADASHLLPPAAVAQLHNGLAAGPKLGAAAVAQVPGGQHAWALAPIRAPTTPGQAAVGVQYEKGGVAEGTVGYAYVELSAVKGYVLVHKLSTGALVLLGTVPVGVLFGLATTHGLRRRLRGLADASQAVAAGDFSTRVVPASHDEVGQLERNFNDMTARLGEATRRELELASQNARLGERSRISRELHDSISQELFSLALLAGGLQRALPPTSPLQPQISTLAETVATALREMRALVLDLHPSALEDKGLVAALEDLCAGYRAEGGFALVSRIDEAELDGDAQHAVLRVAQEALANAARHASAARIVVELHPAPGGGAELAVTDDGCGFDPQALAPSSGVGLRLMRERVGELGGKVTVESAPGRGTTVRAVLVGEPAASLAGERQ